MLSRDQSLIVELKSKFFNLNLKRKHLFMKKIKRKIKKRNRVKVNW